MGKRAPTKKQSAAKARQAAPNDLEVLHPEASITLRGRVVVMREYGYVEAQRLQVGAKPLLESLFALFPGTNVPPPSLDELSDVMAEHAATVQWMQAQAITPAVDVFDAPQWVEDIAENAKWIATLNEVEGDALQAVWWTVNTGFFSRRLRRRRLAEMQARAHENPSPPPGSTQP